MSYVSSGKKSSTPSILKTAGRKSIPGRTVRFHLSCNLRSILLNYEKNKNVYVEFVCSVRDSGFDLKDDELMGILSDTCDCIPILDEKFKLLVQVLLIQKWACRSDEVVFKYQNFILDICSAYNYYTKFALQQLVQSFLEVSGNAVRDTNHVSEDEQRMFDNVHFVIQSLLKIVPMSIDVLLEVVKRKFPFRKQSALCHLNYIHNMLTVASYAPALKFDIVSLIINKLIHVDVMTSKEEIQNSEEICEDGENSVFIMDTDDITDKQVEEDMKNEDAKILDLCLQRIYKYLYDECHDENGLLKWDKTKSIYHDVLSVFENILLPTHASIHIQFIIFYFLSFKSTLAEGFINFLWNKAINPNVAPVIRQASLCYMSGILSRATYISVDILRGVLDELTTWIHTYIEREDFVKLDSKIPFTKLHGVFYSACHALFYMIVFRNNELLDSMKGIRFIESLNLGKIILSRFNPLSMCSEYVADRFTFIMHKYQLTYCNTVTKTITDDVDSPESGHEDFFPFDLYLLKKSGLLIYPLFREYHESQMESEMNEECFTLMKECDDNDDFIPTGVSPSLSHLMMVQYSPNFSCITTPGFN